MRFRTKLSALLAVVLFAFTFLGGTGVGAQEDIDSGMEIGDLEGIQYAVNRSYTIDYSALMENMTTPGAELEMPSGLVTLSAIIVEFESSDNAESALSTVSDEFAGEDFASEGVEEIDLELGDQNISFAGVEEYDGIETELVVTIVQKDNYLYVVYAGSSDIDLQQTIKDFTNTLIENDGSGEGELNEEDGTYSGGLWDKFPSADDELVSGLTVIDMVIYPESETEEPAA